MQNVKNVTEAKLTTDDMLSELPIGIAQLRKYIQDGRLRAEKVRNKFYVNREDFSDFKKRLKF